MTVNASAWKQQPEVEAKLKQDLRWPNVEAIPGFPVPDFETLQRKSASGDFTVRVDAKAALETAQWAFGKAHYLLTSLLTWVPFLTAIAAIPAAFVLGRVAALLLAPTALIAMVVAVPGVPAKRFFKLSALVASGFAVWFAAQGATLGALLLGGYALSYWAVRLAYYWNGLVVWAAVLNSEPLFIILYQSRGVCLQDKSGNFKWA